MAEPTMMPIPSLEKAQVELGKRRLRSTKPAGLRAREDPWIHAFMDGCLHGLTHSLTHWLFPSMDSGGGMMGRVSASLSESML